MEKRQYDLFLEILRRFHKAGLLDDVILIGSWTTVLYKVYFKGFERLKRYALVTRDLDLLVDYPNRIKEKVDIPQLLEDLGFVVSFVGTKGYIHLVHPDLIVEFLTPERGRGVDKPVPLKIRSQSILRRSKLFCRIQQDSLCINWSWPRDGQTRTKPIKTIWPRLIF